jgi:ankyrin repeat protein
MSHSKDVINKLDKLEKETGDPDLDKVYAEIYDMNTKPETEGRIIATRAFKWMMCTARPLEIIELAEAVSVGIDGIQDPEVDEEFILKSCSNFIIADASRTAQFAHLSVREYLEKRETGDIKEYSPEQAHTQAAVTCLAYVNTQPHISGLENFEFGLHGYSVLYWAMHWEMVSENRRRSGHLGELHAKFLAKGDVKSPMMNWVKALSEGEISLPWDQRSIEERLKATISSPPNPLFAACVWGFSEVIAHLLMTVITNLIELNVRGRQGLSIASGYGHEAVVRLLFEQGADVNAKDGDGWTALHGAASRGHEAVVRLLVEKGADVNAKHRDRWTALHEAAYKGHEAVVRLLVEKGADVNAKHRDRWTALHLAAEPGHEAVVRLLVKEGADVNAKDDDRQTALHLAAGHGHEAMVRLLVKEGADVNAKDNDRQTALH